MQSGTFDGRALRARRSSALLLPLAIALPLAFGSAPARSAPAALPAFAAISAGNSHTCALTSSGGVECWGDNGSGQLGNNTTTGSTTPVDVGGLGSGVAAVGAGLVHTCALTSAGGVKCWGSNVFGELGDGAPPWQSSSVPVDVSGLGSGVAAIGSGTLHTCAVTTGGGVKCWGPGNHGQLGDGTDNGSGVPVDVVGLGAPVAAATTGGLGSNPDPGTDGNLVGHTCALTDAGAVLCWGDDEWGEVGNGSISMAVKRPAAVVGLGSGVAAISAGGAHTCSLTTSGAVKCWGDNRYGQLGDGTTTRRTTPVTVAGLGSGVLAISAGSWHTCAVTKSGAVECWGSNRDGRLGDGTTTDSPTPVAVVGLGSRVAAITAGDAHTCALTTAGAAKCWGLNYRGQLGDGTLTGRPTPVDVTDQAVLGRIGLEVPNRAVPGVAFTVRAIARDLLGTPIPGYTGSATWSDLSGALAPAAPVDFVDGVSTTSASVGVPFRSDRITVTSGGVSSQSGLFNVIGPFRQVAVGVGTPVTMGAPFTVTAVATDTAGNTVTSYSGPATWSSLDGGISPAAPNGFVNGVSTTSATIPSPFAGDRITVASGGMSGQSSLFDVRGAASIQVRLDAPVSAGAPFTVRAVAKDASGRTMTNYDVPATWSSLDGGLTPASPSTFVNGISTTTATIAGPFAGDRITLTSGGTTGRSAPFDVLGSLASLTVKVVRTTSSAAAAEPLTVGAGVRFTVLTQAFDAAGNLLTTYSAPASWSDLSGALSPAGPSAFANGVSVTGASVGVPFRHDRITVTAGGVSGQSAPFTVVGPLAAVVVKVATPVTHGAPFTVRAVATDALGTPIAGYAGAASWSSLDRTLSPAAPTALVDGVSTTSAAIASVFAGDRITVATGGVSGRSGVFNVH